MGEFVLPREDEHVAIWGRTGSGKTQLGAWLLSVRDLKHTRNIIIDYKGDELLNSLERTREIGFREVPEKPGLYILRGRPDLDEDMERWLWGAWDNENLGLYIDEGYMIPQADKGAFAAILTQGRSKRIPVITLSQRPVHVTRFAISEASHVCMFDLNDERDIQTARGIVPKDFPYWVPPEFGGQLPAFHARWYSVKSRDRFVLRPVPDAGTIRANIDGQLDPKVRWL